MDMDHVELACAPGYSFKQSRLRRHRVGARPAETQGTWPDGLEFGARGRIAAGKQRHVMFKRHQLLDQPRDDPLGAAVELRRNAFSQGRKLCNPHDVSASIRFRKIPSQASRASTWSSYSLFPVR